MSILGDIANTASGAATGGIIGAVGAIGGRVVDGIFKGKEAKQALEAKQVDYSHEKEMAQINQDGSRQAAQESFDLTKMQGDLEAFKATINDQINSATGTSQWVHDVLALCRPTLTLTLIVASFIAMHLKGIDPKDVFSQYGQMAGIAVAWWFASRDKR